MVKGCAEKSSLSKSLILRLYHEVQSNFKSKSVIWIYLDKAQIRFVVPRGPNLVLISAEDIVHKYIVATFVLARLDLLLVRSLLNCGICEVS